MDKPIIVIIFIILFIGFAIYVVQHSSEIFKALPRGPIPSSRPTPYYNYGSQSSFQTYGGTGVSGESGSAYLSTIPDYQIPEGFTRDELSPYFNKIRISSAYAGAFVSAPSEIRLYSYLSKGESANVSGWRLKSNHGEIIITQAVNIYDPSGMAPPEDIVLSGTSYVNIYGNTSPIARNLRLNKCIGFLENQNDFNPDLPKNCPYVSRSGIINLSGQCQVYVLSLGACQMPDSNFYNLLPGNVEGNNCRNFLNTINYGSCFQDHRSDADFLSNEWRVWVNQNILDPRHDILRLFDKQGLLVAQYSY